MIVEVWQFHRKIKHGVGEKIATLRKNKTVTYGENKVRSEVDGKKRKEITVIRCWLLQVNIC